MPDLAKMEALKFIRGDRPKHSHECDALGDEKERHLWECNSPYCNFRLRRCTRHTGPEPKFDE